MRSELVPVFVQTMPPEPVEGTLYVSITFSTAIHLCCCGCGGKVVTPLSPVGWRLIFDGETVSLLPSIGNWSFTCQSHYWIRNNRVRPARQWSEREIALCRYQDTMDRKAYFGTEARRRVAVVETAPAAFDKDESG